MIRLGISLTILCILSGCTSVTVDQMRLTGTDIDLASDTVVVLGRQHSPAYEAEGDLVTCVARELGSGSMGINVIPDDYFVDSLYPWFEPRTAPLRPTDIEKLMQQKPVMEKLAEMKTEYMVWIDGSTIRTEGAGSMTCGIGPGGAGCFGFGTWGNDADYEAAIWDFTDQQEVGRMSTTATGQSYMPAVIIPIPIIAPVQGTACDGLGDQLLEFLSTKY